ncbi:MAG: cytochrome P450 [Thermomicrobiales bacterium]
MTTRLHDEQTETEIPSDERTVIDFRDPAFLENAYDIYARLRAEGPVSQVTFAQDEPADEQERIRQELFPGDIQLVTHYDEGTEALLDTRFSVNRMRTMSPEQLAEVERAAEADPQFRPFQRNLLSLDPPDHTRLRKLVQPSFTARAMEALKPRIRQIAEELLDAAEREAAARGESAPNRTMDLVPAFAYPLPVTVISEMVGIPVEDRTQVRYWTENLLRVDRGDREAMAETRARIGEFIEYLKALFERRRHDPVDDLVSQLVQAEEDGDKLDEDELLAMVFIVYIAGFVTTVNLIGNGTVALLTHPDQLARFRADPSLASNVVEETLRYWGPAEATLPRTATEDVTIGETVIARGEQMMVSLASIDRDPARFAHPDVYDILRDDANRHVAFGKGIHACLGAPLARVEGQIAFEVLFGRYPELRLAVPEDEIRWNAGFLRGFGSIPLLF